MCIMVGQRTLKRWSAPALTSLSLVTIRWSKSTAEEPGRGVWRRGIGTLQVSLVPEREAYTKLFYINSTNINIISFIRFVYFIATIEIHVNAVRSISERRPEFSTEIETPADI